MAEYTDASLDEIAEAAGREIEAGATIYQKFTCERCGDRVVIDTPNQLFTKGRHDDCAVEPGCITDLQKNGCNYMAIRHNLPPGTAFNGETQRR